MKAFTIFKKEMKDILRDRRTILTMIIIPLLIFPVLMNFTIRFQVRRVMKAKEKVLKTAVYLNGNDDQFLKVLQERSDFEILTNVPFDSLEQYISSEKLDLGLVYDEEFDENITNNKTGTVELYFKSTNEDAVVKERLQKQLEKHKDFLLSKRLEDFGLQPSLIEVMEIKEKDLASMKEKAGEAVGGMIVYFFLIFSFAGSMYPAIDLGAGEKERGTLETLMITPVKKYEILTGKLMLVALAGVISSIVAFIGLYYSIHSIDEIPRFIFNAIGNLMNGTSILMLASIILPMIVFFASVQLGLSFYAKSFKEAQSIINPFVIVMVFPLIFGMMPGVKLSAANAWIPALNVSLAAKEIIGGTLAIPLYLEVVASLLVLAVVSVYVTSLLFRKETIIFRGS